MTVDTLELDLLSVEVKSITVPDLEGSKAEVVWRDKRLKAPARKGLDALKAEKEKIAAKLVKALLREKEIQVAHAETALEAAGEERVAEEQN